jgi:hypothetical protein
MCSTPTEISRTLHSVLPPGGCGSLATGPSTCNGRVVLHLLCDCLGVQGRVALSRFCRPALGTKVRPLQQQQLTQEGVQDAGGSVSIIRLHGMC